MIYFGDEKMEVQLKNVLAKSVEQVNSDIEGKPGHIHHVHASLSLFS